MPDATIADLVRRVKILEAHVQLGNEIPGQLGGLSAVVRKLETTVREVKDGLGKQVDGLEATVRDPKDGLERKVNGLEATVRHPKDGLERKVDGLEVTVRDPRAGLEAKVDDLRKMVPMKENGEEVEEASQLAGKVSRIEGQIAMAMWLGPVVVAVIALVIQVLSR